MFTITATDVAEIKKHMDAAACSEVIGFGLGEDFNVFANTLLPEVKTGVLSVSIMLGMFMSTLKDKSEDDRKEAFARLGSMPGVRDIFLDLMYMSYKLGVLQGQRTEKENNDASNSHTATK